MRRTLWTLIAAVVVGIGCPTVARADKVVLTNGDTLHGEVNEEGGRVRIEHAILGRIDLARSDVLWIQREGEAPPAAAVPSVPGATVRGCPVPVCAGEKAVEKCPSPWDFAVGFGISNDSGNTEKFQFNADLEAGYRWRRNELRWRVNSFYEEAQGIQTEGKVFSNFSYTRKITPRGRLFGMWILDRDDFADIELRNAWLAGYQHDFFKTTRTSFGGTVGAGGAVEKRTNVPQIETATAFAQLRYEHAFRGGDTFLANAYVIPYLDYTERSPMRLELRYTHPLRDHFDVTAGFLMDYVPEPPGDTESYDTKVTFGIRWKP